MNQLTMEAYAEIDTILSFMDEELVEKIPEKLRKMFKERKAKEYEKEIDPNVPIEEQFVNNETLSILAVLNYNYWCKDEHKKEELLKMYEENEKTFQEELREKYNPDNNNMFFLTTKGKKVYSDVEYSKMDEVFILFGKETKGLPEDILLKYFDNAVRIPMRETLRSLNLSNSVAIVVYEILRQVNFDNLEEESKYFNDRI